MQRFVKFRAGSVLPHDPGVGVANFFHRIGCQPDQIGIPLFRVRIMLGDALPNLHKSLLNMARFLRVMQVFRKLLAGKFPAEPGIPPE